MTRSLHIVERLQGGEWVPMVYAVWREPRNAAEHRDSLAQRDPSGEYRVTPYVPAVELREG